MAKDNAARMNDPDYALAARIMREDIAGLRDKHSKGQGELSAQWKRIEKEAGVNKAAAKVIFSLLNKSENHVDDFLRTFVMLADAAELAVRVDLVSLMEGNAERRPDNDEGDDPEGDDEESGE